MADKNKILIDLSESDKTLLGKEDFATQSIPQKVFSCIWALEADVNNGGFNGFFHYSSEEAGFVVEALNIVGAPPCGGNLSARDRLCFSCRLAVDTRGYSRSRREFLR